MVVPVILPYKFGHLRVNRHDYFIFGLVIAFYAQIRGYPRIKPEIDKGECRGG
jgi:hypothetical protein